MAEAVVTPGPVKTWFIAVRPFAYTASAFSVVLGLALAYHAGYPVHWGLFALTLVGVMLFHTAANLLNDCYDHRRGLDTAANAASGAVVRGLLTERQVFRAALGCLVVGVAIGLYLTYAAGWVVLALGLVGTAIAVSYTTSGRCLKFAGLGDAAIFVAFGVLPVFGTWWVQTRAFGWAPVLWSVPQVLFTVGILHANNWRDIETDPASGSHTLAGRVGRRGSALLYRALVFGPFALVALYYAAGRLFGAESLAPATVFVSFLALPLARNLVRKSSESGAGQGTFVTLDALTAKVHTAFSVLITAAFLLGAYLRLGG